MTSERLDLTWCTERGAEEGRTQSISMVTLTSDVPASTRAPALSAATAREHHGMSKNPVPDSTSGLESSESHERALARAIVADAVDRYL